MKTWKMWKTTHLVLGEMNAQGEPDDQGSQRKVLNRSPCAVILHNCIYYPQTDGLQPHAMIFIVNLPQNLLFLGDLRWAA